MVYGADAIVEYVEFYVVGSVDREFFVDFDIRNFEVRLNVVAIVATRNYGLNAEFAFVAVAAYFCEELPFVVFGAIVVDVHAHVA